MSAILATQLGPLTWVRPEIEFALERTRKSLDRYAGAPESPDAAISAALASMREVTGALQIIGMDALGNFSHEVEELLQVTAERPVLPPPVLRELLTGATNTIGQYLADLMAGEPEDPMSLLPIMKDMARARGAGSVDEQCLFHPDLAICPPPHPTGAGVAGDALSSLVKVQRSRYQRGMLSWLRDSEEGLELMRDALQEIERAQPQPSNRAVWWIAAAFVEGLIYGGLSRTDAMKRLAGKIDRHLAAFVSGIPESTGLIREILFHLTRCESVSPLVRDVKILYRLDRYFEPPARVGMTELDAERFQAILREIHQALASARTMWASVGKEDKETPIGFRDSVTTLESLSKELDNRALADFVDLVLRIAKQWGAQDTRDKEAITIEVGVALIAAEQALEALRSLTPEVSAKLDSIRDRLLKATREEATVAEKNPELSHADPRQQADDRQLVSQVAREMLSNLQQVEQTLDSYFRRQSTADCLKPLDGLMRNVSGALRMLGAESPAQLIERCTSIVEELKGADGDAAEAETTLLADGLSSVMLYIEALDHGYSDELGAIDEILARFESGNACATLPWVPDFLTGESDRESQDVGRLDLDVLDDQGDAAAPCMDIEPSAEESDEEDVTAAELAAIVDQFDLSALKDEDRDQPAESEADGRTGTQPLGHSGPAAFIELPAELRDGRTDLAVIDLAEHGVDAEIVSIFIEEATEILGEMSDLLDRVRAQTDSEENLKNLRRGFHTLKGSGRMAGLHPIGDAAWTIESVMNSWLEAGKPASEALINLADAGRALFAGWIAELAREGRAIVRTDELDALAKTVEGDLGETDDPGAINLQAVSETAGVEATAGAKVDALSTGLIPEVARIGHELLPGPLFAIFIEEARHHVAILREGLPVIGSSADRDAFETVSRAAHTLGGMARAVGFYDIGLVAGMIENASPASAEREQLLCLGTLAVEALETMVETVAAGSIPLLLESQREDLANAAARLQHPAAPRLSVSPESDTTVPSLTDAAPKGDEECALEESSTGTVLPGESRERPTTDSATLAVSQPGKEATTADSLEPAREASEQVRSNSQLRGAPERRLIKDDIDEQLLPLFLEEVRELIPMVGEDLRHLRSEPSDAGASASLRRVLHTIKGGARMVGAIRLGELVHVMEERLEAAEKNAVTAELLDTLEAEFDRLTSGFDALACVAAESEFQPTAGNAGNLSPATARKQIVSDAFSSEEAPVLAMHTRVAADTLDRLLNQAGEISISRGRIEVESQKFEQFVLELTDSVSRLRGQLREIEIHAESRLQATLNQASDHQTVFDPLEFDRFTRFQELTRLMAESLHDVSTVQQDLLQGLDEMQAALSSQSRLNRSLQDDLVRLRTVPFQNLGERLHRLVRQLARETGKKAALEMVGAQTGVDRGVLERMAAPLEHLVRNAITHGIEASDRRAERGKPEIGALRLTLRQEARHLLISLSDDGHGIDHRRIREKAVKLGWIPSDAEPTQAELEQLICRPGFSTATEVNELAGRGIGMDVVANEVRALGGNLEVTTEFGSGTTFSIRVPITVAVAKAVLVTARGRQWAILASLVEQVQEVPTNKLSELNSRRELDWMGRCYPLYYFPELIGEKVAPSADRPKYFALLIHSADRRVGVLVDQITVNQELVLKKIGPQLAQLPGVSGATVLSDGEVVLILNPANLAAGLEQRQGWAEARSEDKATTAPLVMVVDDSLTVRNVTSRLLIRNGYRVATARDGLDALQQMQEATPDVLLADIEMPRMDGFDLTKNCKASPRTASIPIIMITSRLAPKHREYARQLGVNAYLGKPYEEAELLAQIARVTASTAAA